MSDPIREAEHRIPLDTTPLPLIQWAHTHGSSKEESMEPAKQFARKEALSASGTTHRLVAGLIDDLEKLRNELATGDQDAAHFATALDYISGDLDLTRTAATRWVLMEQVIRAR